MRVFTRRYSGKEGKRLKNIVMFCWGVLLGVGGDDKNYFHEEEACGDAPGDGGVEAAFVVGGGCPYDSYCA